MSVLRTFRMKFGFTLTIFSQLLQCKRTQLTMSESGRRSLPQDSKKILRHLEQAVEQYAVPVASNDAHSDADTTFLNKQIKSYEAALAILTLEKEAIVEKMEKAKEQEIFLAALQAFPLPTEEEEAHLQLQILERKLPNKMKKLSRALILIQLKMGGLQGELNTALGLF